MIELLGITGVIDNTIVNDPLVNGRDLTNAIATVEKEIRVPLTANQFSAIVSFTDGSDASFRSTMLCQKLNEGAYAMIPDIMRANVFVTRNGRPVADRVLAKRRNLEAELFNRAPNV